MKLRYLYFEIVQDETSKKEVRNQNVLLFEPHTNSNGVWQFTNLTDRGKNKYLYVNQYWINVEKFLNYMDEPQYDEISDIVMGMIYDIQNLVLSK